MIKQEEIVLDKKRIEKLIEMRKKRIKYLEGIEGVHEDELVEASFENTSPRMEIASLEREIVKLEKTKEKV